MRRLVFGALSATLVAFPLACGNASRTEIKSVPDSWQPPPPGQALIILARPDESRWSEAFIVVDDKGSFVADLPAESRVQFFVPAGHHVFVGWSNKLLGDYLWASRVELDTAPGLAYFVFAQERQNGLQLVVKPEKTAKQRACEWEAQAFAARRIESDKMSALEYLDDAKVKGQIAESREWLEDLGMASLLQLSKANDGIPAMVVDPKVRGSEPANFCAAVARLRNQASNAGASSASGSTVPSDSARSSASSSASSSSSR